MTESTIKTSGYSMTQKIKCNTAFSIPYTATDCYVVVYVANSSNTLQSVVPLHTGINIDATQGEGCNGFFRFTVNTNLSINVNFVGWYNADRTSDSYYQVFYK